MDGDQVSRFALAFCEKVAEAGGYTPCVYTNKTMAYGFFDLELLDDYPLWYAEYQPAPSLYYHFDLWQYTDSAAVPGIPGEADVRHLLCALRVNKKRFAVFESTANLFPCRGL